MTRLHCLSLAACLSLTACGASIDNVPERTPEARAEPARSASDGEVLGANRQSPQDTLEGSLTNEHGAPTSPHAEPSKAEAAHERLDEDDCIEAEKTSTDGADTAVAGAPGERPKKRVCPKPEL
jgi:hypothetical protein